MRPWQPSRLPAGRQRDGSRGSRSRRPELSGAGASKHTTRPSRRASHGPRPGAALWTSLPGRTLGDGHALGVVRGQHPSLAQHCKQTCPKISDRRHELSLSEVTGLAYTAQHCG